MNDRNFLYVMLGLATITALLLLSMLLFGRGSSGVEVEEAAGTEIPYRAQGIDDSMPMQARAKAPAGTQTPTRTLTATLAGQHGSKDPQETAGPFHLLLFEKETGTCREFGPFLYSPVEIPAPEAVYFVFARARRGGATLFSPVLEIDLTLDDMRIGLMLRKDGCLLSLRTENDEGFFGRIELRDDRSIPLLTLPSHEGRADLVLPEGLYHLLVRGRRGGPPLLSEDIPLRDRAVSLMLVVDPARPAVETLRERREPSQGR